MNGKNLEPVIKILAKAPILDHFYTDLCWWPPMTRMSNISHAGFPHPFNFPFLQNAQKLYLNKGTDFPNFIQKEGAAIRIFKTACAIPDCTRKSAFHMTEELAFKQRLAQGTAVNT